MKKEVDVRQWISPMKLSYTEICTKFGIDIENDRKNAFFWNLLLTAKIVVNDDLLSWCGYTGEYKNMKMHFMALLKKNTHMAYSEIEDAQYRKKRYIVMESLDFESLLMQMRSRKAQEIRKLYSILKHISTQYTKYEKYFEEHRNELILLQNNQLTNSVNELKDLVLQVKDTADKEVERAEEERRRAEEERQLAEKRYEEEQEERRRAEKRCKEEQEERKRAEKRHFEVTDKLNVITKRIRSEVVDRLRNEIAPRVSPAPINANKQRCLGLINIVPRQEWYIIRRQRESFNKAITVVLRKHLQAKLIREWQGVPHAVDIGNSLKLRLRNIKWMARGNILRMDKSAAETYSDNDMIAAIENILRDNAALKLSNHTEEIIE